MSRKEWFLYLLVCVLWGAAIVAVKISLRYAQPLALAGLRFMVAGIVLLPYLASIGKRLIPRRQDAVPILLIGVFNFGLVLAFHNSGLRTTPASLGAVLLHSHSVIVALLAPLILREQVSLTQLAGIGIGFCGVGLATWSDVNAGLGEGPLLILLAAFSWAVGTLIFKNVSPGRDPLTLTAHSLLVGGCVDFILSLFLEEGARVQGTPEFYAAFLFMAIPGQAVTGALWFWLLGRGRAATATSFLFLVPIFGMIFSFLVLSEKATAKLLAGGLLVGLAIWVVNRSQKPSLATAG